eukprot:jgi/Galph1/477/GphlegSOOS_G5249.1
MAARSNKLGDRIDQLFYEWQENFQPLQDVPEVAESNTIEELKHYTDTDELHPEDCSLSSLTKTTTWTEGLRNDSKVFSMDDGFLLAENSASSSPKQLGNGLLEEQSGPTEIMQKQCSASEREHEAEPITSTIHFSDPQKESTKSENDSSLTTSETLFETTHVENSELRLFQLLLFLNYRRQRTVDRCLERISSVQNYIDNAQGTDTEVWRQRHINSFEKKTTALQNQTEENSDVATSHPLFSVPLYKFANFFVQRHGKVYGSPHFLKGYVPFLGNVVQRKNRRIGKLYLFSWNFIELYLVLQPEPHRDVQRVGSNRRKELSISFDRSVRPRNFHQIVERLVIRTAQEDLVREVADQVTKGLISSFEFQQKLKRISNMSILELTHRTFEWDREKWFEILKKEAKLLAKNVQADDMRLYWINYGAPVYRKELWTKREDEKLLAAVEKYKGYLWDEIAKQLNTGRSAWQCFCRYERELRLNVVSSKWTTEEDMRLLAAVERYGTKRWSLISCCVPGRTRQQCLHRWKRGLRPDIHHGKWTKEEDERLTRAVETLGERQWSTVAKFVGGRTDLQCRERYTDILKPSLRRQPWTDEENERLLQLIRQFGKGKWSLIASHMSNRTDNQCYRQYKKLKKAQTNRSIENNCF